MKKLDLHSLPSERPYVKFYLDHICDLKNVSAPAKSVLMALVGTMTYKGFVAIRPKILEGVADECNLSGKNKVQQVRNKMTELSKVGMIKKVETGTYAVNPWYFARGDWKKILNDRNQGIEGIKFTTIFTDEGVSHNAEIKPITDNKTGKTYHYEGDK